MNDISVINDVISVLFTVCYLYQLIYLIVGLLHSSERKEVKRKERRFAVLICARNEEKVLPDLLDSLQRQDYPSDHIYPFVLADNCTDGTYEAAAAKGVEVYRRTDEKHIGKGYALNYLLKEIMKDHPEGFDGYAVFDADNIVDEKFFYETDLTMSEGYDIVTCYRNSKNYGSNWISAGYALWFLRESQYLNRPRYILNTSCSVSGTGFVFSDRILNKMTEWPYHLLTEDIEFSVEQILENERIGYCERAVIYDEQPVDLISSYRQRLRWARGYLQVFSKCGKRLLMGILHGSFACFDMVMVIMPAYFLSLFSLLINLITTFVTRQNSLISFLFLGIKAYVVFFLIGIVTVISEWDRIRTTSFKKICYCFSFPIFMFTYIPISFMALFVDCSWKQIEHRITLKEMKEYENKG